MGFVVYSVCGWGGGVEGRGEGPVGLCSGRGGADSGRTRAPAAALSGPGTHFVTCRRRREAGGAARLESPRVRGRRGGAAPGTGAPWAFAHGMVRGFQRRKVGLLFVAPVTAHCESCPRTCARYSQGPGSELWPPIALGRGAVQAFRS